MKEEKITFTMRGTAEGEVFNFSFEDKKEPSEKGLGYVTNIVAFDEEMARKVFEHENPDCEVLSVEATGEPGIFPLFLAETNAMTLKDYQSMAMRTCLPSSANFSYMMLNLMGEVGEFAGKVGKAIRKEQVHVVGLRSETMPEELENELMKEAGDVLWQLSGLCSVLGWDLEEVARMNLEKLAIRQMEGTIDGNGDGNTKEEGRK